MQSDADIPPEYCERSDWVFGGSEVSRPDLQWNPNKIRLQRDTPGMGVKSVFFILQRNGVAVSHLPWCFAATSSPRIVGTPGDSKLEARLGAGEQAAAENSVLVYNLEPRLDSRLAERGEETKTR